MRELWRRLLYLLNRRHFDAELEDEMAFHREMATSGGVPLGDPLRLREDARDAWGFLWLDHLEQDLRYALRSMRASLGFSTAAVLVLAVGIGATVAAFSAFNIGAFRPLPVRDPDTILRFGRHAPGRAASAVPYPAMTFYREHARTLSAVLGLTASSLDLEGSSKPVSTFFVTANFFDELGGRAAEGRLFTADDARSDASNVVVLGHRYWVTHFGADPSVIGTVLRLNGREALVIGVVSRAFSGLAGDTPDCWVLVDRHADFIHGSQLLTDFSSGVAMWGRMALDTSPSVIEDELATLTVDLRRQHPEGVWEGERLTSKAGARPELVGAAPVFAIVGLLALLILTVACGNLGSLLVARGAARQREMSLRTAIGAGPGRLVRQLFTESLVLALIGCLGGLVLGSFVLGFILRWSNSPDWFDPTPDWRVAAFALGMGLLSSMLFGLAPAVQTATRTTRKARSRSVLIGAQVASSCVLLIVAGLLGRAVDRARWADLGFDYERILVIDPSLAEHGYTAEGARAYLRDLGDRVQQIAGIEAVSVTSTPPLGNRSITAVLQIDGRPLEVYIHQVDSHYLETMRIPLLRGRGLSVRDERGVVVSESFVQRKWPDQDPLGQLITIGDEPLTVVGIAGNARSLALTNARAVELYRVARGNDFTDLAVIARTAGPTEDWVAVVAGAAQSIDANIKPRLALLRDTHAGNVRDIQNGALAVSVLGVIALCVASLGVVGLVAYSVAARRREIGIRLALGARPVHVLKALSTQFARPLAGGLIAGVLGAAGLAQLLRQQLYGVSTLDPLAYLAAVGLFVLIVGLAALWPARRALGVDPAVTLRCD